MSSNSDTHDVVRLREGMPPGEGQPDRDAIRADLALRGHALVREGSGAQVVGLLQRVGTDRTPELDLVQADALLGTGDWDAALIAFQRMLTRHDPLPDGFTWRYASLLYLRGDAAEALEVLTDERHRSGGSVVDVAMGQAWLSTVQWSLGDIDAAAALADDAVRTAQVSGDPAARAAAHISQALVAASRGDRTRNQREYRLGSHAAREARDHFQLARIHANLASRAMGEGDYDLAVTEAEKSIEVGAGHPAFVALAHANRAESLFRLGKLDEARLAATSSIEAYDRHGSLRACSALSLLATIDYERGDLTRARLGFERAVRLAEAAGDVHGRVQAQAGLVRTLVYDEPELAAQVAEVATASATALELADALTSAALVALRTGDLCAAATLAARAEAEARRTDDLASLAAAMELRGVTSTPVHVPYLTSAAELWRQTANPVGAARAELLLARFQGDAEAELHVKERLAALGLRPELGVIALAPRAAGDVTPLSIITLGRFAVLRDGEPVPATDWQSRKARDLLKLLVARHGRAVTRDAVAEALWPGETAVGNKLSVALSTLRKVLDPGKTFPADHVVAADGRSLTLRVENARVDVIDFLRMARAAEAAAADGWDAAVPVLVQAQSLYAGDFLEEDRFADWSVNCREQARSAALAVCRLLARAAVERGDADGATYQLHRLLELDPYDEHAWLALVGAHLRQGHHGEARRQHDAYARHMDELGVPAVPLHQAHDRRP